MTSRNTSAGYTLLEVLIASAIFATVISMVMGLFVLAVGMTEMDTAQTHVEDQVQNGVDDIVADLKETSPGKVTFYQFVDDGRAQTAICMPCARDQNGGFIYKVGGSVQNQPVWQCVRVYCYVPEQGIIGGWIYRYDDYSARSYTNPISVTSVTNNAIHLSDGTTFNRKGPAAGNQQIFPLSGRFVQMEAAVPTVEEGGGTDFEIDPDLIEDVIQDQEIRPLRLTIRSEVEHKMATLSGGTVVTTLTNEVLSRNRN